MNAEIIVGKPLHPVFIESALRCEFRVTTASLIVSSILTQAPGHANNRGREKKRFLSNDFKLKAQKPFFLSPFKTKFGVPE